MTISGILGILVIMACIVGLISYTIYRHFKLAHMKHIKVDTAYQDNESDMGIDPCPLYDVHLNPSSKLRNPTSNPNITKEHPICREHTPESSDNFCSYSSASSNSSSDVYLDQNDSSVPIEIQSDIENEYEQPHSV